MKKSATRLALNEAMIRAMMIASCSSRCRYDTPTVTAVSAISVMKTTLKPRTVRSMSIA